MGTDLLPCSVGIVSDRPHWTEDAVDRLAGRKFFPERISWSAAAELTEHPDLLVVDLPAGLSGEAEILLDWATRCWPPICTVSLEPELGGRDAAVTLRQHGYERSVLGRSSSQSWDEITKHLAAAAKEQAWIIPEVNRVLDSCSAELIRVLSIALSLEPDRQKVQDWVSELGRTRSGQLAQLLEDVGWPEPKTTLDIFRVVRAVDFAQRARVRPSRAELASRVGYGSADYFGKRVKALTGESPGRLIERSLEEVIELILERM